MGGDQVTNRRAGGHGEFSFQHVDFHAAAWPRVVVRVPFSVQRGHGTECGLFVPGEHCLNACSRARSFLLTRLQVTTSDSRTRANSLAAVTSINTTNPYSLTLKADPVPPLVYLERRALTEAEAVELGEVRTTGTRS